MECILQIVWACARVLRVRAHGRKTAQNRAALPDSALPVASRPAKGKSKADRSEHRVRGRALAMHSGFGRDATLSSFVNQGWTEFPRRKVAGGDFACDFPNWAAKRSSTS